MEDLKQIHLILSNHINEQFIDTQEELSLFLEEDEQGYLSNISLSFSNEENPNYLAYASYTDNNINFALNSLLKKNLQRTIIHEFSHHIAKKYLHINGHTLEFAIINYCLQKKVLGEDKDYFRSYDIHEDKAYNLISIRPSQFDTLINNICFRSLLELANKANYLSMKIRQKSIPYKMAE